MATYPNVNAANQYARDVVGGKILACQLTILSCSDIWMTWSARKILTGLIVSIKTKQKDFSVFPENASYRWRMGAAKTAY
jgi:hypothetical protein